MLPPPTPPPPISPEAFEALRAEVAELTRHIVGNHRPGLLERTLLAEQELKSLSGALARVGTLMDKSVTESEALRASIQKQKESIDELVRLFKDHLRPENPDHHTIMRAFIRAPVKVTLYVVSVISLVAILVPVIGSVQGWILTLLPFIP